jgi:hypothetical protein
MEDDQVRADRRRRRDFIRAHHPDRGGDPAAFIVGIRSFDPADPAGAAGREPLPPVRVVRRRAWPAQLGMAAIRRLRRGRRVPRVR